MRRIYQSVVALIASKWEFAFLNPDTKVVDVTSTLVSLYNPGEKTPGFLRDMKERLPFRGTPC